MVFFLFSSIAFRDTIQPVCLPESGQEFSQDDDCYAAGWGRTQCKLKF